MFHYGMTRKLVPKVAVRNASHRDIRLRARRFRQNTVNIVGIPIGTRSEVPMVPDSAPCFTGS